MSNERRLVAVPIHIDLMIDMMREGYTTGPGAITCTKGLPEDAVCISSYHDWIRNLGMLVFYHDSFDVVPPNEELPIVTPEFTRTYEQKGTEDE